MLNIYSTLLLGLALGSFVPSSLGAPAQANPEVIQLTDDTQPTPSKVDLSGLKLGQFLEYRKTDGGGSEHEPDRLMMFLGYPNKERPPTTLNIGWILENPSSLVRYWEEGDDFGVPGKMIGAAKLQGEMLARTRISNREPVEPQQAQDLVDRFTAMHATYKKRSDQNKNSCCCFQ